MGVNYIAVKLGTKNESTLSFRFLSIQLPTSRFRS